MAVICIRKIRDTQGKIVSYLLEDEGHNQKIVEPLNLKAAIINGTVQVTNLKLTSDGRLIDCNPIEGNTKDDILAIQDEYNAKKFVEHIVEYLNTLGIRTTLEKLDTRTDVGILSCAVIEFNNGKLVGTSENELDISAKMKELIGAKEHRCYGIAAGLLVKTTQKDGNNKLLDYKILFGKVKRAGAGNALEKDSLLLGDEFCTKMRSVLNYRMDTYETINYASSYNKEQVGKNVNYQDLQKQTSVAAEQLSVELVRILGVPDKQLSKSYQIGRALGGIAAKVMSKQIANNALNSGYNADIVNAHKEQIESNKAEADSAAEFLGTDNSRLKQKQETEKKLKHSKGLSGMMKAFTRK